MPKITVADGPSNAAAGPGEPGYRPPVTEPEPEPVAAEPPPPPPPSALKPEHVEYATEQLGVPAEEAEHMTKPELVELAKKAAPTLTRSAGDGG